MWEQMPGHGGRRWGMPGVVGANGKLAVASRLCGLGIAPGWRYIGMHLTGTSRVLPQYLPHDMHCQKKKKKKTVFGQGFWKML